MDLWLFLWNLDIITQKGSFQRKKQCKYWVFFGEISWVAKVSGIWGFPIQVAWNLPTQAAWTLLLRGREGSVELRIYHSQGAAVWSRKKGVDVTIDTIDSWTILIIRVSFCSCVPYLSIWLLLWTLNGFHLKKGQTPKGLGPLSCKYFPTKIIPAILPPNYYRKNPTC